jgi:type I restriction enzyme S subunit
MYHGIVPFAEHFSRPHQSASLVGFKLVKPNQLVVNRMQAGNGLIFVSTLSSLVSPDYSVFDTIKDVSPDYLGMLFRSNTVRAKFRSESKGLGTGTSGFLRLYDNNLLSIHITLPPKIEQIKILEWIAEQSSGFDTTIKQTEREIGLMEEYRTRLVADVVTGQVDVREAARHLPELDTEAESINVLDDVDDLTDDEPEADNGNSGHDD